MKKLILLSGKKRNGKSSCGLLLKQLDPRVKLVALATPLKSILSTTLSIPMTILEEYKDNNYVCVHGVPFEDQENTEFQMQSYREMLQNLGDALKQQFGQSVFAVLAYKQILKHFEITDTVVITDWRFPREFDYLWDSFCVDKESCGHIYSTPSIDIQTWRISRDLEANDEHISETALDAFDFDEVIENNGTIEELKAKLKELL